MLPLGENKKQRAKCLKCGAVYLSNSRYGTCNLKYHINSCVRRDTTNIGQLLLSHDITLRCHKVNPEKFRELMIQAIIKHDLHFQFVEYERIIVLFDYVCPDITLVSRNTTKADAFKLYSKEKARIKSLLKTAPGRICFIFDGGLL